MNEAFLGHPAEVDIRVAEVGNFSAEAKMAVQIFARRALLFSQQMRRFCA